MKKQLFFVSLIALAGNVAAQATWNGSGTTGNAYRSGKIGINVSSPAMELDISTPVLNNGIGITQTGSGFAALRLSNTTTGGRNYALTSTGAGNTEGAGHFGLYDYTSNVYRYFMTSTGNFGIGLITPASKLHVISDDSQMANNPIPLNSDYFTPTASAGRFEFSATSKLGVHAALHAYDLNNAPTSNGNLVQGYGLFAKVERTAGTSGNAGNFGVSAQASGGNFNVGGTFSGGSIARIGNRSIQGNDPGPTAVNFGLWASASGDNANAGYFNGSLYSAGLYQSADINLKKDIQPLTSAIEKLNLLKPVTFNFNKEEHAIMNLPTGRQMGFNAQDVEKVMPELVKEIRDLSTVMETGKLEDIKSFKTVNYINLIPLLVSAVQEQAKTAEHQQKQIDDQKQIIEQQKQQIGEMIQKTQTITDINQVSAVTPGFVLEQNIPNPFGQQTVIKYTLPETVKNPYMAIYDLTGKQLMSFPLTDKGSSSVTIGSERLSPGIYIYSVIGDGKVLDSKRMVVEQK